MTVRIAASDTISHRTREGDIGAWYTARLAPTGQDRQDGQDRQEKSPPRSCQSSPSRLSCPMKPLIIAIDGPSGAGKGTVARAIASALGYRHVDSGAMYRAVGWKARRDGVPLDNDD